MSQGMQTGMQNSMSQDLPQDFSGVQRIVLHGSKWAAAGHLMLSFKGKSPLRFLHRLRDTKHSAWPTAAREEKPGLQFSLGFTRRGLEHGFVPDQVLSCLALKAPAFWAGATLRGASRLGLTGPSAPECWDAPYAELSLHAVLSIHATDEGKLGDTVERLLQLAEEEGLACKELLPAPRALLAPPADATTASDLPLVPPDDDSGQWVHFGYRDGLSRIAIKGWTRADEAKQCLPISTHAAGEFVLGHPQDSGARPWIAGPRQRVWPDQVRAFFHNGSFGVLQQIEQHVAAFEAFVQKQSREARLSTVAIKGKLCGRYPDGRSLAKPAEAPRSDDFDYGADPQGLECPFGSHVRRMNPRPPPPELLKSLAEARAAAEAAAGAKPEPETPEGLAHFSRSRPLLRRGMPYGSAAWSPQEGEPKVPDGPQDRQGPERGLIGQFFCASIEDQYEHLVGEWADRVPMGSPDGGGARDPLIGAHERGDGLFEIPRKPPEQALRLDALPPFTTTRGVAYLFYPSLQTLEGIADSSLWGLGDEDDDE